MVDGHEVDVRLEKDRSNRYSFDAVLPPEADQAQVYDVVGRPVVDAALAGMNACIFAYGQTGSGKTHTMTGETTPLSDGSPNPQRGVVARIVEALFASLGSAHTNGWTYVIDCSCVEIYNENITDLLDTESHAGAGGAGASPAAFGYSARGAASGGSGATGASAGAGGSVSTTKKLRETSSGGVYVEGVSRPQVATVEEALALMDAGLRMRTVGSTAMNAKSSRSHAIFTLHLTGTSNPGSHAGAKESTDTAAQGEGKGKDEGDDEADAVAATFTTLKRESVVCLVDLAGSERQAKTGTAGAALKEASKINQSLSNLNKVIQSLAANDAHIGYRNSKLTRLLQGCIGGNSRTFMIANINPTQGARGETLGTLRFAHNARRVKNKVRVNQTNELSLSHARDLTLELADQKLLDAKLKRALKLFCIATAAKHGTGAAGADDAEAGHCSDGDADSDEGAAGAADGAMASKNKAAMAIFASFPAAVKAALSPDTQHAIMEAMSCATPPKAKDLHLVVDDSARKEATAGAAASSALAAAAAAAAAGGDDADGDDAVDDDEDDSLSVGSVGEASPREDGDAFGLATPLIDRLDASAAAAVAAAGRGANDESGRTSVTPETHAVLEAARETVRGLATIVPAAAGDDAHSEVAPLSPSKMRALAAAIDSGDEAAVSAAIAGEGDTEADQAAKIKFLVGRMRDTERLLADALVRDAKSSTAAMEMSRTMTMHEERAARERTSREIDALQAMVRGTTPVAPQTPSARARHALSEESNDAENLLSPAPRTFAGAKSASKSGVKGSATKALRAFAAAKSPAVVSVAKRMALGERHPNTGTGLLDSPSRGGDNGVAVFTAAVAASPFSGAASASTAPSLGSKRLSNSSAGSGSSSGDGYAGEAGPLVSHGGMSYAQLVRQYARLSRGWHDALLEKEALAADATAAKSGAAHVSKAAAATIGATADRLQRKAAEARSLQKRAQELEATVANLSAQMMMLGEIEAENRAQKVQLQKHAEAAEAAAAVTHASAATSPMPTSPGTSAGIQTDAVEQAHTMAGSDSPLPASGDAVDADSGADDDGESSTDAHSEGSAETSGTETSTDSGEIEALRAECARYQAELEQTRAELDATRAKRDVDVSAALAAGNAMANKAKAAAAAGADVSCEASADAAPSTPPPREAAAQQGALSALLKQRGYPVSAMTPGRNLRLAHRGGADRRAMQAAAGAGGAGAPSLLGSAGPTVEAPPLTYAGEPSSALDAEADGDSDTGSSSGSDDTGSTRAAALSVTELAEIEARHKKEMAAAVSAAQAALITAAETARRKAEQAVSELEAFRAEAKAGAEVAAQEARAEAEVTARDAAQAELTAAQERADAIATEVEALRASSADLQSKLEAANAQLQDAVSAKAAVAAATQAAEKQAAEANEEAERLRNANAALQKQVSDAKAEAVLQAESTRDAESEREALKKAIARLTRERDEARREATLAAAKTTTAPEDVVVQLSPATTAAAKLASAVEKMGGSSVHPDVRRASVNSIDSFGCELAAHDGDGVRSMRSSTGSDSSFEASPRARKPTATLRTPIHTRTRLSLARKAASTATKEADDAGAAAATAESESSAPAGSTGGGGGGTGDADAAGEDKSEEKESKQVSKGGKAKAKPAKKRQSRASKASSNAPLRRSTRLSMKPVAELPPTTPRVGVPRAGAPNGKGQKLASYLFPDTSE